MVGLSHFSHKITFFCFDYLLMGRDIYIIDDHIEVPILRIDIIYFQGEDYLFSKGGL